MRRRGFLTGLVATLPIPLFIPDKALASILTKRQPGLQIPRHLLGKPYAIAGGENGVVYAMAELADITVDGDIITASYEQQVATKRGTLTAMTVYDQNGEITTYPRFENIKPGDLITMNRKVTLWWDGSHLGPRFRQAMRESTARQLGLDYLRSKDD